MLGGGAAWGPLSSVGAFASAWPNPPAARRGSAGLPAEPSGCTAPGPTTTVGRLDGANFGAPAVVATGTGPVGGAGNGNAPVLGKNCCDARCSSSTFSSG